MPFPKKGTPEYEAWRNSPAYEEYRMKLSTAMQNSKKYRYAIRELWQDALFRERHRQAHQSKKFREKCRERMKNAWQEEEHRAKVSQAVQNLWQDEDFQTKQRQIRQSEEYRECRKQIFQSGMYRKKMRLIALELWQEPKFVQKVLEGRHQQTQPEQQMESLLDRLFPGEYQFVGLGEVIIGGKIPDFINVNGQKKIIEVYGNYWHQDDDPQERIDFFRQFGFETLVVWESELQNIDSVVEKLVEFHNV